MLNYTIGAVRKKKSTAKSKGLPNVTPTCRKAGSSTKAGKSKKARSTGAGILAMCKAVAEGKNLSARAKKKYSVTKVNLKKRK
jgi:hypothetical protein